MANPEHVEIVKKGAEAIKNWRDAHTDEYLDLSDADFSGLDRSQLFFGGDDLFRANLNKSRLEWANFVVVNLNSASLCDSNVSYTRFYAAQMSGADFRGAHLTSTVFDDVEVKGANFSGALLKFTKFIRVDLSGAIGLVDARIDGQCFFDIDTIFRSRGKIPEQFLRDCGVPDALIAYIPSLVGATEPIQFYSCFISHSTRDTDFAQRLHSRLRDEKLRVWYAPEDMRGGQKFRDQIEQAIRVHEKLLLVLSKESMQSDWVKAEIVHARKREQLEKKQVLFPICLVPFREIQSWKAIDPSTFEDLAAEVCTYHIPDFSNWKDQDSFEAGFKRLLADLRKEADKEVK